MSSLNCPEEVILSEKLLEMHDYIEMLKFARSGGEANSIAIKLLERTKIQKLLFVDIMDGMIGI